MSEEEYEAMEEGHYWFCLNDLSYYVERFGLQHVLKDLGDLQANHKKIREAAANRRQVLDDIPF